MSDSSRIVCLLSGPDKPGIVARVAGWIFERQGNIIHADQHRDDAAGIFFQRVVWAAADGTSASQAASDFQSMAESELGMNVQVLLSGNRPKVVIMVSKIAHCFHDIILRFKAGEMPGELVGVISNHQLLEKETEGYGLPFYHIPVSKDTKATAEKMQTKIIRELGAELVVMARYMQVLSDSFLSKVGCPVINIHHSFLPAFAGGKPYHQAHERGVKLIGATAHYATADLDEGPIIAQEVSRISHRNNVPDLVRRGKDLEKTTFSLAVRWHLEGRILVYNNRTVVFD